MKNLNHVQSRESIILELSACPVFEQHHSISAHHPTSNEMKHNPGQGKD